MPMYLVIAKREGQPAVVLAEAEGYNEVTDLYEKLFDDPAQAGAYVFVAHRSWGRFRLPD